MKSFSVVASMPLRYHEQKRKNGWNFYTQELFEIFFLSFFHSIHSSRTTKTHRDDNNRLKIYFSTHAVISV